MSNSFCLRLDLLEEGFKMNRAYGGCSRMKTGHFIPHERYLTDARDEFVLADVTNYGFGRKPAINISPKITPRLVKKIAYASAQNADVFYNGMHLTRDNGTIIWENLP